MKRNLESARSLVKPSPPRNIWEDPKWQKAWLGTQRRPWRTLGIVPSASGISTVEVAQNLMDVGWQHRGEPMTVADFREVQLSHIEASMAVVNAHVARGERVIVALRSVTENAATAHVAQLLDCALLCVPLGDADVNTARQTIEEVGHDRFVGSLVLVRGR